MMWVQILQFPHLVISDKNYKNRLDLIIKIQKIEIL